MIHGIMLLLIFGMIGVGAYMTDLDKTDEMRKVLFGLHMSTGVLVLFLGSGTPCLAESQSATDTPCCAGELGKSIDHRREVPDVPADAIDTDRRYPDREYQRACDRLLRTVRASHVNRGE